MRTGSKREISILETWAKDLADFGKKHKPGFTAKVQMESRRALLFSRAFTAFARDLTMSAQEYNCEECGISFMANPDKIFLYCPDCGEIIIDDYLSTRLFTCRARDRGNGEPWTVAAA